MDTGWKYLEGKNFPKGLTVSILIIMDTGWKGGNRFKYLFFRM